MAVSVAEVFEVFVGVGFEDLSKGVSCRGNAVLGELRVLVCTQISPQNHPSYH